MINEVINKDEAEYSEAIVNDEMYNRGYRHGFDNGYLAGRNSKDKSCAECKYSATHFKEAPCINCRRTHSDHFGEVVK